MKKLATVVLNEQKFCRTTKKHRHKHIDDTAEVVTAQLECT